MTADHPKAEGHSAASSPADRPRGAAATNRTRTDGPGRARPTAPKRSDRTAASPATRTSAPSTPTGSSARAGSGASFDRSRLRPAGPGHSSVAALLAETIGEQVPATGSVTPRADHDTPSEAVHRSPEPPTAAAPLPEVDDVLIGLVAVIGEYAWRLATRGAQIASATAARAAGVLRAVSPTFASAEADARLKALAERGRRVRQERAQAINTTLSSAITSAATSDAVREMTVTAIEQATDDVLAVVLPAALEAVTEIETQEKLDELMAGLLLRQLPAALEKTLPGVMLRTATKPAMGLVPSIMGALTAGLAADQTPAAQTRPDQGRPDRR